MKNFLFNVYIQLLLFIAIHGQLSIISPSNLVQLFYNRQIEMAYGKIGNLAEFYIRGQLYMESVTEHHDACTPLTGLNLKRSNNETIYDENYKILLAYRGTCSFAQKARNAQDAGASMLIVINVGNTPIKNVIFDDDSNDVYIPVTLINHSDGKMLEDYINLNKGAKILAEVNFSPQKEKENKVVDFKFFFSASEPRAYDLIGNLTKSLDSFGSQIQFTPYYVVHKNPYYVEENPKSNINCLSRGIYCYYPKETTIVQEGQKILLEDLRQKCMYTLSKEKSISLYFEYMINFGKECLNKDQQTLSKLCSQNTLQKLGYPETYLDKCIAESFGVSVSDLSSASSIERDNKILISEYNEILKYKLTSFPAVVINDKLLSGIIKEESIIAELCVNVKVKPLFCPYIAGLTDEHRTSSSRRKRIIYYLIVLLIIVNIFLFFKCKNYIIKKTNEGIVPGNIDIDGRIKQLINNYYDLKRNSNDYKAFESNSQTSTAIEMQEGNVSTV